MIGAEKIALFDSTRFSGAAWCRRGWVSFSDMILRLSELSFFFVSKIGRRSTTCCEYLWVKEKFIALRICISSAFLVIILAHVVKHVNWTSAVQAIKYEVQLSWKVIHWYAATFLEGKGKMHIFPHHSLVGYGPPVRGSKLRSGSV